MARITLDQIRNVGDFATVYQWNLYFAQFPNIGSYPSSGELNLRCLTSELPQSTNQKIPIGIRGHKVFQPGIREYTGTLTLTFAETIDNTIAEFLREWEEACTESNTGRHNIKQDVEAVIIIERLDREDNPIYRYTLVGCFIETFEEGQLDGESSEIMRPSITISYDRYKKEGI